MLDINTVAPDFNLLDQNNVNHTLSQYKGGIVIIYFYPKDDTPGCTKEACMIAEVYDEFKALNVTVIGVSKDSPASHKKFADKYKLPFTLLSDQTGEMIDAYGALAEKSMFGKKFTGINRVSYLIDKNGLIIKAYPKVDPANHAIHILEDVKKVI
jgi:peroxiredoxin Q/BCP